MYDRKYISSYSRALAFGGLEQFVGEKWVVKWHLDLDGI